MIVYLMYYGIRGLKNYKNFKNINQLKQYGDKNKVLEEIINELDQIKYLDKYSILTTNWLIHNSMPRIDFIQLTDVIWIRVIRIRNKYNRSFCIEFRDNQGKTRKLSCYKKKIAISILEQLEKNNPNIFMGDDKELLKLWNTSRQEAIKKLTEMNGL